MREITNNTIIVKKTNMNLVLSALREMKEAKTTEVAKVTNLSIATCGTILKELCKTGEIIEGELQKSSGGRPARNYIFNANHSLAICITITSDKNAHCLECALVNLQGEIISKVSNPYEMIDFPIIDRLIADLFDKHDYIKAIGIGIPGITWDGIITHCDVEELNGVALKRVLQEKYGVEVTVENEMHAKVYGYHKNHPELLGQSIALLLAPRDHCLGAGFFVNGQVIKGSKKMAGEIGFLPFDLSKEETIRRQNDEETLIPIIVKSAVSILSIINPENLILTGSLFKPYMLDCIIDGVQEVIPEEFLPKIEIKQNLDMDYLKGIVTLTLESLSSNILLIKK